MNQIFLDGAFGIADFMCKALSKTGIHISMDGEDISEEQMHRIVLKSAMGCCLRILSTCSKEETDSFTQKAIIDNSDPMMSATLLYLIKTLDVSQEDELPFLVNTLDELENKIFGDIEPNENEYRMNLPFAGFQIVKRATAGLLLEDDRIHIDLLFLSYIHYFDTLEEKLTEMGYVNTYLEIIKVETPSYKEVKEAFAQKCPNLKNPFEKEYDYTFTADFVSKLILELYKDHKIKI